MAFNLNKKAVEFNYFDSVKYIPNLQEIISNRKIYTEMIAFCQ